MRTFAGIEPSVEAVPDATTLLHFRHLLEAHDLTRLLFEEVGALLEERQLLIKEGTIVDATIIAAPCSTKNARKERDPEMHQTKKGHQWYFEMKAHIGVDARSGLVHRVSGTVANVADIAQTHALLHGREKGSLCGRRVSRSGKARGDRHPLRGRGVAGGSQARQGQGDGRRSRKTSHLAP